MRPTARRERAHFERNRERYLSPLKVDISIDRLARRPANPRRPARGGEALVRRLRTGETDFDATARQMSVARSAAKGGRLGLHA